MRAVIDRVDIVIIEPASILRLGPRFGSFWNTGSMLNFKTDRDYLVVESEGGEVKAGKHFLRGSLYYLNCYVLKQAVLCRGFDTLILYSFH